MTDNGISTFEMYEDDGTSTEYRQGRYTITKMSVQNKKDKVLTNIGSRLGTFTGMVKKHVYKIMIHLGRNRRRRMSGHIGSLILPGKSIVHLLVRPGISNKKFLIRRDKDVQKK